MQLFILYNENLDSRFVSGIKQLVPVDISDHNGCDGFHEYVEINTRIFDCA